MSLKKVTKRILLISIFVFLYFNCSEEEKTNFSEGPISLEGIWSIQPSEDGNLLDFSTKPGYAILIDSMKLHKVDFDKSQEFVLLSDGKGVRIQSERETVPTGYFLYQDRKKEVWLGLWQDKLVRLVLQGKDLK